MKLEFSRQIFKKNSQILNFMKIRRVGAELVPWRKTDGRTDVIKLTFAFRSFANARKKYLHFNSLVNVPPSRTLLGGGATLNVTKCFHFTAT